jgi:hypothetical protein
MKRHGERGQTVVELMVGMAVTAIVLGALSGLLFVASDRGNHWVDKVNSAADGFALASSLQADLHSYVPCPGTYLSDTMPNLMLNTPGSSDGAVMYYASSRPGIQYHDIRRVESSPVSQSRRIGGSAHHPVFVIEQSDIRIQRMLSSGADLVVYFTPLPGSCT